MAPLPASVKKPMIDKIQAQMNKPPPPDPKMMAIQAKAAGDAQERQQDAVLEQQKAQRENAQAQQDVVMKQQAADRDFANQCVSSNSTSRRSSARRSTTPCCSVWRRRTRR